MNAGGALSYFDGSGIQETSISVENSTDYLLSVRRTGDAEPVGGFAWRLEKLSDNTVQTASSGHGDNASGTGLFDLGGNSSYSAAGFEASNLVVNLDCGFGCFDDRNLLKTVLQGTVNHVLDNYRRDVFHRARCRREMKMLGRVETMNDYIWVFVNPEQPFNFAMIPPTPTKLYIDWWDWGSHVGKFLFALL